MNRILAITLLFGLTTPALAEGDDQFGARMKQDLAGKSYKDDWLMEWPNQWSLRYHAKYGSAFGDIKNPEPEWIRDWSGAADGGVVGQTVAIWVQAIVNRTWSADAEAAYTTYRKEWADVDAQLRPELDKIKAEPNTYVRLAMLADLREQLDKAAESLVRDGHHTMPGLATDILAAAREEMSHSHIGFIAGTTRIAKLYPGVFEPAHGALAQTRPWLDDATEHVLFLDIAREGHAQRLIPHLPVHEYMRSVGGKLKWPVAPDAVKAAEARVAKAVEQARSVEAPPAHPASYQLEGYADHTETRDAILEGADPNEPKLVRAIAEVKSIKKTDKGTQLVLEHKAELTRSSNCHVTNHIESIDSDGKVHYEAHCKVETLTFTRGWKVTFAELPPGGVLVGDKLTFWADLESAKGGKTRTDLVATGRWIECASGKDARCRGGW